MKNYLKSLPLGLVAGFVLLAPPVLAQPDPGFRIETIQMVPEGAIEFTFRDAGTGAVSYFVQFSPDLGGEIGWTPVATAAITPIGDGAFQVVIPDPTLPRGFYRVVGVTSDGEEIIMNFATATTLEVEEGETAFATVTFSAPFTGTLRYTLSGTATSDDFEELSGEVFVSNGTQAVIPVTVKENASIDPVRNLILTIQSGGGATPGLVSQFEILVKDADARWEGGVLLGRGEHSLHPRSHPDGRHHRGFSHRRTVRFSSGGKHTGGRRGDPRVVRSEHR